VNPGRVLGRGISFPPRVGPDGRVAWSEGEPNIREAIRVILETGPGERPRLPRFGGGLDTFLFEPNTTGTRRELQDRIGKALADWEPRVTVDSIDVDEDPHEPQAAVATVSYKLVATQARERVSLSVLLGG
jgi:phage baseplate assembly protein W